MMYNFYPRPPRGGRRSCLMISGVAKAISIHALREEGDVQRHFDGIALERFLSTPSARRATASKRAPSPRTTTFLSTPSARRATRYNVPQVFRFEFLSTPSARRATLLHVGSAQAFDISIHALREEGD